MTTAIVTGASRSHGSAVGPGAIMTGRLENGRRRTPAGLQASWRRPPIGHGGTVEGVAAAVVRLMSEEADFDSGEVLTSNGSYAIAQA